MKEMMLVVTYFSVTAFFNAKCTGYGKTSQLNFNKNFKQKLLLLEKKFVIILYNYQITNLTNI